jgi:hypothetical protein
MIAVLVVAGLLVVLFLAPRLAAVWIRWRDRAPGNDRARLAYSSELPRYFIRDAAGKVDTSVRWPGWDAWTASAIPTDASLPPQLIRGTLMTGLYGLEGIDNYETPLYRLSAYQAVEHLCLVPTTYKLPEGASLVLCNLSQNYLDKQTDLEMADAELDVTILGSRTGNLTVDESYGHLEGTWPNYKLYFRNPAAEIRAELSYHGERIVWWTDLPGSYTHFSAFGTFDAIVEYARGTVVIDPHRPVPNPRELRFQARGTMEHISAIKPFGFDWLWLPMRYLGRWVPSLKPILYHHEVVIADGLEGGILHARAFGVDFRNGGGLFAGTTYYQVKHVTVSYTASDPVDNCGGIGALTPVYRTWDVCATTDAGELAYAATRTHPPAMVAPNTNQYHFAFQGSWCGSPISGRGFGEYIHL